MKKFMSAVLFSVLLISPALAAFSSDVQVVDRREITRFSDQKLVDTYMDVLVELQAIKTFHTTSGFSVKQYDEYRDLLKFRLGLLMEIHNRNLEIPQQMELL
jgi:hypothetical protein